MVNNRVAQISDDVFGGYRTLVDLDELRDADGLDEIVSTVRRAIREDLVKLNLDALVRILDGKVLHIHDKTIEEYLLNENLTIWVCGHC